MIARSLGRRVYAAFYLCYCGFIFCLKRLWPFSPRRGYQQFLANYAVEGLPSFSPEFRKIASSVGDCTSCGLCDVACPQLRAETNFAGPMRLVASSFRGGPLLEASRDQLHDFVTNACVDCQKCDQACPEGIAISTLAYHFLQQLPKTSQKKSTSTV